jgi:hypothetical protein
MHKLERGQKLLYVGSVYGSNRTQRTEVTVVSVGRTWAQIEGPFCGRLDMETLVVDGRGFGSPGTCYLSREHYQQQEGPKLAWNSLRAAMGNTMPNGVSYENVVAAAKLLGIDVEISFEPKA